MPAINQLVRNGRHAVKYKTASSALIIRGTLDSVGANDRKQGRSKYGAKGARGKK